MTKNKLPKSFHNRKIVSLVFLGLGLSLFILNISSMLSFLPLNYNKIAFDMSIFASMLIVIYSVYMIHSDDQ